jgi:hypothetical protein
VKHITAAEADLDDPIAVIYREDEMTERVTTLIGVPALDLQVLGSLPYVVKGPPRTRPPNPSSMSVLRRLSGRTLHDPRPPKALAEALGFLYLEADAAAINPNIGFTILRITPRETATVGENRARTNLFWETRKGVFQCMQLLTDVVELAALTYGAIPKSRTPSPMSPARPRRRPALLRREGRAPK